MFYFVLFSWNNVWCTPFGNCHTNTYPTRLIFGLLSHVWIKANWLGWHRFTCCSQAVPTGQVNLIWYTIGKHFETKAMTACSACVCEGGGFYVYAGMCTFRCEHAHMWVSTWGGIFALVWPQSSLVSVCSFELCDKRRTCSGGSSLWTIILAAHVYPWAMHCQLGWQFQFRSRVHSNI